MVSNTPISVYFTYFLFEPLLLPNTKHTDTCHTRKSSDTTSHACYTYVEPPASCPHISASKTHLLTGGGGCGGGGCIWGAGGAMKPGIGGAGAATGNGGRAGTEYIYHEPLH